MVPCSRESRQEHAHATPSVLHERKNFRVTIFPNKTNQRLRARLTEIPLRQRPTISMPGLRASRAALAAWSNVQFRDPASNERQIKLNRASDS
ncbi:MAG: hypothetical protein CMM01_08315 [Rhodopirellula sp.]|nr:hypothetical protein [Rhodopirellula sp.]